MKTKKYFASGKLYIAGEYAVVFRKSAAILAPLRLGIQATISKSLTYTITTSKYEGQIFRYEVSDYQIRKLDLLFIQEAVRIAFAYLKEMGINLSPFHLHLDSTLESKQNEKFGFGSSAAVTVATLGAILSYFEVEFTKEDLYKLAVLSQIHTYPHSSYGDIASSVMNQWIFYKPFSLDFLKKNQDKSMVELLRLKWHDLDIRPFDIGKLHMMVIWTKKEADSSQLVKLVSSHVEEDAFMLFAKRTAEVVEKLFSAFTNQENLCIINDILTLNILLKQLGDLTTQNLYTETMKKIESILQEYECGAKFSGAGAGDCMIAIFNTKEQLSSATKKLKNENYEIIENIVRGVSNEA